MFLNNKLLAKTSLAGGLVMLGVALKNTSEKLEQLKLTNTKTKSIKLMKIFGVISFVFGWIITAYALSCKKKYKLIFVLASAGILTAVLVMKSIMAKNMKRKANNEHEKKIPKILPVLFIICWQILGLMCANHLKGPMKLLGILPGLLVVLSMMFLLPAARRHCLVDFLGVHAFFLAWVLIVGINSMRN